MAAKKAKTSGKKPKKAAAKKAAAKKAAATKPVATKPMAKKVLKKSAKRPPGPPPKIPRAPGERRYFLLKTEPEVFSFEDLVRAPNRTAFWDGVRNYQARNTLRDDMKEGDGILVYHSNAEPPAIVGYAEVAREGSPDPTQFEPKHDHFDPKSKREAPTWIGVDVRAVAPLARPLGLPELKNVPGLQKMVLLQRGSRLSVQPVSAAEWAIIEQLGGRG